MKLLYVYIGNFKNRIKDQEFLLDNQFNIAYNSTLNCVDMEVNEKFIVDFFSIQNPPTNRIKGLTGIIGKNGSGKSTLLDFFRYTNADIYKIREEKYFEIFMDEYGDVFYFQNNMPDIDFKDKKVKELSRKSRFNLSKVLFLSTVLDRKKYEPLQRETNNSTNYLLKNINEYDSEKIKNNLLFLNRTDMLKRKIDIKIEYLSNVLEELSLPEILSFSIINIDSDFKYAENLKFSMFKSYIDKRLLLGFNTAEGPLLLEYSKAIEKKEKNIFEYVEKTHKNIRPVSMDNRESHLRVIKRINKFSKKVEKGIQRGQIIQINDSTFELNDIQSIKTFIKNLDNATKQQFTGLSMNWRELSTGEEMILDIFSRLLDGISYYEKQPELQVIILDEIENALHPQWQKKIIALLINFLEVYFDRHKFQVILTSHSPFLVSDIPSHSLILIHRDKIKGIVNKSELEDLHLTFGANIHELYTNSFFLEGGVIGDFAKQKINKLAKKLMYFVPKDIKDLDQIRYEIDLIAEPVLRNKLIQIYDEKIKLFKPVNEDVLNIKQEIGILKEQIKLASEKLLKLEGEVE
ncbi:hypothetical protein ACZ11_23835 [Lysinibacillus xylanilyticus]|uniref:AAA+ ATPase domain-containing protein n=1 Tax=Lysinibacillus xylanilyticus TaxID=582475 RepID=A0A0K9F2G7_9BACI|nr:AAA family ATPase [Lysinibacillus xylanilyticus]KMY28268.1 hypothetical protein ACZ11_23835 [Lysinibacillus xylanilyticus]